MREVFISYKSNDPQLGNNDETVANELCAALEAAGISCWIAPRDIEPGVRYGRAIMEAINSCKVMVVVFSKHANTSEHIANEVDAIFARHVDIIPFNIDGSQPGLELDYYLRRMQWINTPGNYQLKIPELIKALKHKLGKKEAGQTIIIDAPTDAVTRPITPSHLTFTVNGVSFKVIRVEGGTFTMGATPEQGKDAESDERPAHQVTLSTYHIGETQVTQELWQAVMGNNPSRFKGNLQCPVENVSWNDCQEFIYRLNRLTGRNFRMPTEAEWEFAARGGNKSNGYKYAGSNNLGEVAWFYDNSSGSTHPVAAKASNELGLYDMSGNVLEWCADWWFDGYNAGSQINPHGPFKGSFRLARGGSWDNNARYCRVAARYSCYRPASTVIHLGLRLAL
jgi:formylglycine-generating enzyme required for sulfatase activity